MVFDCLLKGTWNIENSYTFHECIWANFLNSVASCVRAITVHDLEPWFETFRRGPCMDPGFHGHLGAMVFSPWDGTKEKHR